MIRKYKSFLLVWLLALLQCFVPLLHAHAGGLNAAGGTHVHLDALNICAPLAHTAFHVDRSAAPAVSAPSEFKRDQLFSGDDLAVVADTLPQAAGLAALLPYVIPSSYHPGFHKPTPPAQAPPAASGLLN